MFKGAYLFQVFSKGTFGVLCVSVSLSVGLRASLPQGHAAGPRAAPEYPLRALSPGVDVRPAHTRPAGGGGAATHSLRLLCRVPPSAAPPPGARRPPQCARAPRPRHLALGAPQLTGTFGPPLTRSAP